MDNKTKRDNILYLALLCGKYCYCETRQSCESDVLCWEDDECLGVSECHGTSGQWTCCVWLKSSWPPAPMPAPLELHMPEPETPGEEHQSQCGHLAHPAIRDNCQHIVVELWQSNVCPSFPCPSIIIFLYFNFVNFLLLTTKGTNLSSKYNIYLEKNRNNMINHGKCEKWLYWIN